MPRPYTRQPLRVKNGGAELERVPSVLGTPPRKRAVPADDVHVRNIPEYASGKRSRLRSAQDVATTHASPAATTLRIDHAKRMSREERYQREHQKAASQRQWKEAFVKAFPKLVFYLDHVDAAQKAQFTHQITQLGGTVEAFFSRSVTHVVTTRPIPIAREKENTEPRSVRPRALASSQAAPPAVAGGPVHSDKNPLDDTTPALPPSDLLCKAQQFGMKIWRQDKLQHILSLLLADDVSTEDTRQNLSEMLHQEKLHGTTERDPQALRTDYHYFGKHSYYVLVTDATNEHRPIVVGEFDKTAHEAQLKPPPWPVLYGDVEGRGLFVYVKPKDRQRLAAQDADVARPTPLSLRRAASLNLAGALPHAPGSSHAPGTPSLMASDNSIALASTVASTTSASLHSQSTQLGSSAIADKRLAELTRRMHTPIDLKRGAGSGAVVRRMLSMAPNEAEGPGLCRAHSLSSARAPRKPREKRPGHCENCRCRFEDFDEHTRSRRHRKFAMDESNFVALDELLQRVQREPVDQGIWDAYTCHDTPSDDVPSAADTDAYVAQAPFDYVAGSDVDGEPMDADALGAGAGVATDSSIEVVGERRADMAAPTVAESAAPPTTLRADLDAIVAEVEQAAGAAEEHAEPAAGAADASVEPAVDAADTGMEPMMDATVAGEEPAAHLSATSVTESAAAPLASPRAEEAFSGAIDTHATE